MRCGRRRKQPFCRRRLKWHSCKRSYQHPPRKTLYNLPPLNMRCCKRRKQPFCKIRSLQGSHNKVRMWHFVATRWQHTRKLQSPKKNHQKGKDVILYNVYRDHASPVAKATILSIDQRKLVGGQALGPEYCDIVVNYVIKRDSILPRGVGNMTTMGQAQGRCIAWPYKHLEVDRPVAKVGMQPQAS